MRRKILILLVAATLIGLGIYWLKGIDNKPRFSFSGPTFSFQTGPTPDEKSAILEAVRDGLNHCGDSVAPAAVSPRLARLNPYANPYSLRLWLNGKKLFEKKVQGEAFEGSFQRMLQNLCAPLETRKIPPEQFKEIRPEFAFTYDFQSFDEKYFLENKKKLEAAMGLFGIFIPDEHRWIYPADFSRRNVPFKKLFRTLCGKGVGREECLDSLEGRAFIFNAIHWVEGEDGSVLDLFRLSP